MAKKAPSKTKKRPPQKRRAKTALAPSPAALRPRKADTSGKLTMNLALQGGGAHGAFT